MRSSRDFASVTRMGRRARSGGLVVYLLPQLAGSASQRLAADERLAAGAPGPAKVGLIVGRSVGGSVMRHLVSRRLRAQLASRIDGLPAGSGLVVRALADLSATPDGIESRALGRQLDRALAKLGGGRPGKHEPRR